MGYYGTGIGESRMNNKWIDLEGKTVVVTGGAMGIGEAIAADLKGCGANVAVFDVSEPKDYKEDEHTLFIKADIRSKTEMEAAVKQVPAPDSWFMFTRSFSVGFHRIQRQGRSKKGILTCQQRAVFKKASVAVHIEGNGLSYRMPESRIILKGDMLCGKIRGVHSDRCRPEGSPFLTVLLNLIGSMPKDNDRAFSVFPQKCHIRSGNDQLFSIDSLSYMYHHGLHVILRGRVTLPLRQLCGNALRNRGKPVCGFQRVPDGRKAVLRHLPFPTGDTTVNDIKMQWLLR